MFVSGGNDGKILKLQFKIVYKNINIVYYKIINNIGKIIIWELGSSEYSYILEKIYEFDISFNAQNGLDNNPEI